MHSKLCAFLRRLIGLSSPPHPPEISATMRGELIDLVDNEASRNLIEQLERSPRRIRWPPSQCKSRNRALPQHPLSNRFANHESVVQVGLTTSCNVSMAARAKKVRDKCNRSIMYNAGGFHFPSHRGFDIMYVVS